MYPANGKVQTLFMNMAQSCRLVYGQDDLFCKWAGIKLGADPEFFKFAKAIGIMRGKEVLAAVVYHNYTNHCIEMSIVSVDKRWCNRHNLKALFAYPFTQLGLRRVQALCSSTDEWVQMFIKRLGFSHEGIHPCGYWDGGDALSFGMLKENCKWIKDASTCDQNGLIL